MWNMKNAGILYQPYFVLILEQVCGVKLIQVAATIVVT
jgi:hypothetical protein